MKLPPFKISSKVLNSTVAGLATTIIVGITRQTPLASSEWLKPLQDATVTNAIVLAVMAVAGYQTRETAFDDVLNENNPRTSLRGAEVPYREDLEGGYTQEIRRSPDDLTE